MARKRKALPKKLRFAVYEKYQGRCGYCGIELELRQMQVDHIFPHRRGGVDEYDNLMPACRMCNYYKHTFTVEGFRQEMKTLHERILKPFIARLGARYGMVEVTPFDGVFYYERHAQPRDQSEDTPLDI